MRINVSRLFAFSLIAIAVLYTGCDSGGANDPDNQQTDNAAPSASASADQTTIGVGMDVTLDASGSSDPDGDALSFAWELSVPDGSSAELSDAAAEQPTFTPDVVGDYTATVTVDDGNGETANASVTVTAEVQNTVEVSNDITSSETWVAGTIYRVTTTIEVLNNAILTIEAGTTIEFEADAGIRVNSDNAALVANGADGNAITMTGVQENAGFWRGLAFDSSHPDNKLNYVVIEYGGSEKWDYIDEAANVAVRDGGSSLTIINSTFRHSGSFGLYAEKDATLPNFGNNTFTENDIPVGIPLALIDAPDGGSTYTGNTNDYVWVETQDISEDVTVAALDVPYRITGRSRIEGDAKFTISPGVDMEFTANAGLRVYSDNAAFLAEGTAAAPITMTGAQKSPGFWRGLVIDSSHPNNALDHVTIEYGGGETWDYIDESANLALREDAVLTLSNSTISNSAAFGLHADKSATLSGFEANTFTDNGDAPVSIPTTLMGAPDAGSAYTGNTNDYVWVYEETVKEDMTVAALDVPYRFSGTTRVESDAEVTISAGVNVEFTANSGLRIYTDNASLIADGTASNPITLTGVEESAGFWRGLVIDSSHPNNALDHVTIEYGGGQAWDYIDESANLALREGAQLTLENSTLRHSNSYGGWADDGTGANISYSGNSYSNNPDGDNNYGDPGS